MQVDRLNLICLLKVVVAIVVIYYALLKCVTEVDEETDLKIDENVFKHYLSTCTVKKADSLNNRVLYFSREKNFFRKRFHALTFSSTFLANRFSWYPFLSRLKILNS